MSIDDADAGTVPGPDAATVARQELEAQALARAKEAGWTNDINDPAGPEPTEDETRKDAIWLSDAAVYQWDDEFGEVGEPNPELEKQLFEGDHLARVGAHIKALSFDVVVEGPTKVHPVREVSALPPLSDPLPAHILHSSMTPACTPFCLRM